MDIAVRGHPPSGQMTRGANSSTCTAEIIIIVGMTSRSPEPGFARCQSHTLKRRRPPKNTATARSTFAMIDADCHPLKPIAIPRAIATTTIATSAFIRPKLTSSGGQPSPDDPCRKDGCCASRRLHSNCQDDVGPVPPVFTPRRKKYTRALPTMLMCEARWTGTSTPTVKARVRSSRDGPLVSSQRGCAKMPRAGLMALEQQTAAGDHVERQT